MKKLLQEKEGLILASIKKFLESMPDQVRFETITLLIVESTSNYPICFSASNENGIVEVNKFPAEKAGLVDERDGAVIFHVGNSNADYNALDRKMARKIIQTKGLDFGNFADLSTSVFGVSKEESIFLSAYIASFIFDVEIDSIFSKMDNIPARIKDHSFYLFDYIEK